MTCERTESWVAWMGTFGVPVKKTPERPNLGGGMPSDCSRGEEMWSEERKPGSAICRECSLEVVPGHDLV